MKMLKKNFSLIIATLGLVALSLSGCNAGMSPAGGSDEDVKSAIDKMPLEEKAKFYNNSSMPAEEKKKRIMEMYQKEGKEPPAEFMGGSAAPTGGAPK
jgi:predicted small secreted protein